MVVGVCTGLGECLAVPRVQVAGGDVVCGVIVIADCKMECIGTRATLLVEIIECVLWLIVRCRVTVLSHPYSLDVMIDGVLVEE